MTEFFSKIPAAEVREKAVEGSFVLLVDDRMAWGIYRVDRRFQLTLAKAVLCHKVYGSEQEPEGVKSGTGGQDLVRVDSVVSIIHSEDDAELTANGIKKAHQSFSNDVRPFAEKFRAALRIMI